MRAEWADGGEDSSPAGGHGERAGRREQESGWDGRDDGAPPRACRESASLVGV